MRRCVSVCAVLIAAVMGLSAQTQPGYHPTGPNHESESTAPVARYSPLAAQGGYADGRTSPLEAVIHTLNPHDVNLGEAWERRRRQWLENAGEIGRAHV